ncbi:MAG TPA: FAD-dependent oxidoreductase [Solirubrobacteraceae bacterium]|jgi:sulfide:quinone oxidoreductase|nr:FAD-dependent oxidoreductase [Solirubrobacteraceae bacterium]
MTRIVVAGAGVAAVECVVALHDLTGSRATIELLAPAAELVHRPSSVTTPFGGAPAARIDLRHLATELGIELRRDALASVDPGARLVLTRDEDRVAYDLLVVATGARSRPAVPGAVTFRGPMSAGLVEQAVARVAERPDLRLAFVAPPGVRWLLPLYELAMLSATELRDRGIPEPDIVVATAEHEPLEVFGAAASEAVRRMLDRGGVQLVTSAAAASAFEGAVRLASGELLPADVVVALPEIVGPGIGGLPRDDHGFIPVDEHGYVQGCGDVFAAGDVTAYPLKHGGLAAQQADAVAESIAARLGAIGMPEPFRPVLRGLLLTGETPLYLRADLGVGGRREHRLLPRPGTVASTALWWPPGKIAGRYVTPFVASGVAAGTLDDREPSPDLEGFDLLIQAAEQDAAAGDHGAAVRTLDDAEAWLGPLPSAVAMRRDDWRRLVGTTTR